MIRSWAMLAAACGVLTSCGNDVLNVLPSILEIDGELDFGTAWVDEPVERSFLMTAPRGLVTVESLATVEPDLVIGWDGAPIVVDAQGVEVVVTWTPRQAGLHHGFVDILSGADENGAPRVPTAGEAIDPTGCESDDPCIVKVWDPINDICVVTFPAADCDDDDPCTLDDRCNSGHCDGRFSATAAPQCDPNTCSPTATAGEDPFANRWYEEVWSNGANDIWLVGAEGLTIRWDGESWSVVNTCVQEDLYSVWGTGAGEVWGVGRGGTILHWDGGYWASEPSPTVERLWAVWTDDNGGVWVVGDAGVAFRRDGGQWYTTDTGTEETLFSVWGHDGSNIWAVGDQGTIIFWNGTGWSAQQSFTGEELYAVRGLSASAVWAVGGQGAIVRFDGAVWSVQPSDTSETLFAVALVSANDYWVSGRNGVVRRFYAGAWQDLSEPAGENLYALWANGTNDVWVGGSAGYLWRWTGGGLSSLP